MPKEIFVYFQESTINFISIYGGLRESTINFISDDYSGVEPNTSQSNKDDNLSAVLSTHRVTHVKPAMEENFEMG